MLDASRPVLVIGDTQWPFQHEKALQFVLYVVKHYRIPLNNITHCGDEVDFYHGGQWDKSPNANLTATGELEAVREIVKEWSDHFPRMLIATSNHAVRWQRKATAAQIPSELLRMHREIIGAPEGWIWKDKFLFSELKNPFILCHGMHYGSGLNATKNMALDFGCSVAHGHLHSSANIQFIQTANQKVWGMNAGSLIDNAAFAFEYGKDSRFKPWNGLAIVCNSGSLPILLPIE